MLELSNLHLSYGKIEVLKGVSFTAKPREITTIIGQNGCGKSTLLKAICNSLPISKGDVLIDGSSIKDMQEKQISRQIAYLSQGKNIPDISVYRIVLHGRFSYLDYPRKYSKTDYEIAEAAMKQMGIYELKDQMLITLSGGMRQKVYIAMALCQQAQTILMDEPTTYLDIKQQVKFHTTVKELKDGGKTVVLVLHDIISALKISDKIVVMDEGKSIFCGNPTEVLNSNVINKIYGINVKTMPVDGETQYYYTSSMEE